MLVDACQRLIGVVMNGDDAAFDVAFDRVGAAFESSAVEEMSRAVALFAPVVGSVPLSVGNNLLIPLAAMVQKGADAPDALLDTMSLRVADGLERAARLPDLWQAAQHGLPLPDFDSDETVAAALPALEAAAGSLDYSADQVRMIAEAWAVVHAWAGPLRNMLQRKDIRQRLPRRDRLVAATEVLLGVYAPAEPLRMMLAVLDDEPLLVLHPESRRGFRLVISGVGDNRQLNTLLAGTLIGTAEQGPIAWMRPAQAWVAAATDGDPRVPGGITACFHMSDVDGTPLLQDDLPADIPFAQGERVVVLANALAFGGRWTLGRPVPFMRPRVTIQSELAPTELDPWWKLLTATRPAGTPGPPR